MELRHLRYFITVAEELNFSKAALKLYTAQPSLSQQIKDLEEDVGVKLLNRTKRKVELTEEGAVFLEQARLTLAQADKAVAMARQVFKAKQQRLRIGFLPVAEMKIFPAVLPRLRMQYPQLKLELLSLSEAEQLRRLKKGELDLSFTRQEIQTEDIVSQQLLAETLVLLLPPTHPLACHTQIPLSALEQIDLVMPTVESSPSLSALILEMIRQQGLNVNIVAKSEHILASIEAVSNGLGCTLLPDSVASLVTAPLLTRPLEAKLPALNLYMNYRKNQPQAVVQQFLQPLNQGFPLHAVSTSSQV